MAATAQAQNNSQITIDNNVSLQGNTPTTMKTSDNEKVIISISPMLTTL
jgi:hypothetical protein